MVAGRGVARLQLRWVPEPTTETTPHRSQHERDRVAESQFVLERPLAATAEESCAPVLGMLREGAILEQRDAEEKSAICCGFDQPFAVDAALAQRHVREKVTMH